MRLDDRDCIRDALGRAWCRGVAPDWRALHGRPRLRVPLPTYPFERTRHWIDAPRAALKRASVPDSLAMAPAPTVSPQNESSMYQSTAPNPLAEISAAIAAIFENLSGETPDANNAQTTFSRDGIRFLISDAGGTEDSKTR